MPFLRMLMLGDESLNVVRAFTLNARYDQAARDPLPALLEAVETSARGPGVLHEPKIESGLTALCRRGTADCRFTALAEPRFTAETMLHWVAARTRTAPAGSPAPVMQHY